MAGAPASSSALALGGAPPSVDTFGGWAWFTWAMTVQSGRSIPDGHGAGDTVDAMADLFDRAENLRRRRTPFVLATVIRAERPTSARAADRALVLPDGSLEGFVGGHLRGVDHPPPGTAAPGDRHPTTTGDQEGLLVVDNPCLSGGSLEIFMEAVLPAPMICVVGDSPIAQALAAIGAAAGYDMRTGADASADTVVVASPGHGEEAAPPRRSGPTCPTTSLYPHWTVAGPDFGPATVYRFTASV